MRYPEPTTYTNGQINRAGDVLANSHKKLASYSEALSVVNSWRASHQYPMNTFVSTLHQKTKDKNKVIIAQRLKRLPTIIRKVKRFPSMKLSRMQDVGGVRAVLGSVKDVKALEKEYIEAGRFSHKLRRHDDYISTPKPDGYRGIHLAYEYNNTLARNGVAQKYNGLQVEVQLRTSLQHSWATAVEAMGAFLGEEFKNGSGSKKWREFFTLASSAFAHAEGSPYCLQHKGMEPTDIYKRLSEINDEIDALQHIRSLSKAANIIHRHIKRRDNKRRLHYTIISLDLKKPSVEIWAFRKEDFDIANKKLTELEKRDSRYDQVLVSVASIISLKDAYPNYFLDISDFADKINIIVEKINAAGI